MLLASFYDRTNVVGEQVALSRNGARRHTRARRIPRRNGKVVRKTAIALEFRLNSNVPVEVKCNSAAAPVQRERLDNIVVLRIGVDVRIVEQNLRLWIVLSKRHRSKQQNNH